LASHEDVIRAPFSLEIDAKSVDFDENAVPEDRKAPAHKARFEFFTGLLGRCKRRVGAFLGYVFAGFGRAGVFSSRGRGGRQLARQAARRGGFRLLILSGPFMTFKPLRSVGHLKRPLFERILGQDGCRFCRASGGPIDPEGRARSYPISLRQVDIDALNAIKAKKAEIEP
jgi:hypothetical protein